MCEEETGEDKRTEEAGEERKKKERNGLVRRASEFARKKQVQQKDSLVL